MSPTETKCPGCKGALKKHPTLIGFDVGFYRCDPCKKNYAEPGSILDQLAAALAGEKVRLEEVDDKGVRTSSG